MNASARARRSRQVLFAAIAGCGASGQFSYGARAYGGSHQWAWLMWPALCRRARVWRLTIVDRDYLQAANPHQQRPLEDADAAARRSLAADQRIGRVNFVQLRAGNAVWTPAIP
jgi:hypothetical protein